MDAGVFDAPGCEGKLHASLFSHSSGCGSSRSSIGGQDNTFGRDDAFDQAEGGGNGVLAEYLFAGAQDDWIGFEPKLIHQIMHQEQLDEFTTAPDLEVWTVGRLELLDLGKIVDEDGVLPVGLALTRRTWFPS